MCSAHAARLVGTVCTRRFLRATAEKETSLEPFHSLHVHHAEQRRHVLVAVKSAGERVMLLGKTFPLLEPDAAHAKNGLIVLLSPGQTSRRKWYLRGVAFMAVGVVLFRR